MILTEQEKSIRKEFRKYLREVEGQKGAHPTNPVEGCADANPKTELPNDT